MPRRRKLKVEIPSVEGGNWDQLAEPIDRLVQVRRYPWEELIAIGRRLKPPIEGDWLVECVAYLELSGRVVTERDGVVVATQYASWFPWRIVRDRKVYDIYLDGQLMATGLTMARANELLLAVSDKPIPKGIKIVKGLADVAR